MPYPTDGLVFKFDNYDYYDRIGQTDHDAKYNCAFKFRPVFKAVTTYRGHHTTIGETRCILDGNSRQLDTRSLCVSRNGFTKRLDTIENTGWCSTGNLYPLRIHLQAITFGIGD